MEIAGIKLKNPVMPASGTFGYGEEYAPYLDLERLGAIVTKGLSLHPKAGNPTPRIAETVSGMLNAIGLQNVGVDGFIQYKLPFLRELNTPVIANFFGNTLEEYGEVARRLSDIPEIAGVELNISCPNVKQGGIVFGTEPKAAAEVVTLVRKDLWQAADRQADPQRHRHHRHRPGGGGGRRRCHQLHQHPHRHGRGRQDPSAAAGQLAPAASPARPSARWPCAWSTRWCRRSRFPVIGIGGITAAEDALEFLIVGATAVQVGTANFVDPGAMATIIAGLEQFCIEEGIEDIRELIGSLRS